MNEEIKINNGVLDSNGDIDWAKARETALRAIEEDTERETEYTKDYYQRTITTFSGCDMIVFFNGKLVGELQAITWRRNYLSYGEGPKVIGSLVMCEFGESPLNKVFPFNIMRDVTGEDRPKADIVIVYNNEYGQMAYRTVKGATIIEEAGAASVDDLVTEISYAYVADDITPLTKPDDALLELLGNRG